MFPLKALTKSSRDLRRKQSESTRVRTPLRGLRGITRNALPLSPIHCNFPLAFTKKRPPLIRLTSATSSPSLPDTRRILLARALQRVTSHSS